MAGAVLYAPAAQADVGDGPGGLTLNPTSGSTSAETMGTFTSTIACPTANRFAANVQIVREGTPPTLLVRLSENIFGLSDTPPSGGLDVLGAGGLARIFSEQGLPSGDYQVALLCFNTGAAQFVAAATTWIHVDLAAGTWAVVDGGDPGAVTTTTTLNAQPTTAQPGQAVTLTATVSGEGATGSVEFLNGSASLGTDDVSGGTATLTVDTLPVGLHSLTAKFTPTDPAAFTPSTSQAVAVRISGGTGGGSGNQSLNVTVPQGGGSGELTMSVAGDAVDLEQVSAGDLAFRGQLATITVTDDRPSLAGWYVTGSTSDFTGTGTDKIGGENLGWTPEVADACDEVVAGSPVTPGSPGLKQEATLATVDAGKGGGDCALGGTLELQVPEETPAGDYSATLTVTLVSK
ncbi:Ig-like domain-containing protein [Phytohabitans sp. ZYX-F-186]|uniref:Ig-like domain-containing protein n=1 Tax=Phytohabitans maris TaxID=3071409 RepID=A0ABU0ZVS9_9ACTN|nr:Ig-like domain-containing protein [Phytohabitans sp. ZYX-F-186]MDQ7911134.1 Ig-like domain-containing protein [Phytohabitans sp. ZYX-F-186]